MSYQNQTFRERFLQVESGFQSEMTSVKLNGVCFLQLANSDERSHHNLNGVVSR